MGKHQLFISLAFIVTIVAWIAPAEASYSRLVEQLQLCKQEADSLHRLRCFDNVAAALPEPETVAATPVADKPVAENEASEDFLRITEMWEYKRNLWKIRLVNGEVWEVIEADSRFPFSMNNNYYLQQGMFGSHYLRTPGLNTRLRIRLAQ
ncbi:hypothetical protein CWE15_08575 [Aliidiomarina taiwanensis]|uniref:Uncharacterized protein n=1 Tax=Aliidiomarina taiwanensis TaxID=946228 RepID=A0A432X0W8_9GAMM|nr:hypothetical protein [Aliidiomarina taiwanensis]RUO39804.1 hypothetical protein CWE15_08575 [Aliidiomarina taiwanensis]